MRSNRTLPLLNCNQSACVILNPPAEHAKRHPGRACPGLERILSVPADPMRQMFIQKAQENTNAAYARPREQTSAPTAQTPRNKPNWRKPPPTANTAAVTQKGSDTPRAAGGSKRFKCKNRRNKSQSNEGDKEKHDGHGGDDQTGDSQGRSQ